MNQFAAVIDNLCVAAFAATLLLAAVSDYRHLEIPNWLSIVIAMLFIPAGLAAEMAAWSITIHIGIGVGVLALGAVMFAMGIFGGGDVKLLAGVAIWAGPDLLVILLLGVVIIGGILGLAILVATRIPFLLRLTGNPSWIDPESGMKQPMPYGIAIALMGIALIYRMPVAPTWLSG